MRRCVVNARIATAILGLFLATFATSARAGLGPENVLLVVNSASWASQTVANHYVRLRQIPPVNLMYLNWNRGTDGVDADTFRKEILGPVLMNIDRRGLADQIDAIVYSSDFPYVVNFSADLKDQQVPQQMNPSVSITSATYLWQLAMLKNPNLINLHSNQYVRNYGERKTEPPTHGFRSWYGWGSNGELVEGGGIHYILSTMLAVTSGRGNSVPEAVGYLRRSAKADGTHPKGTIYYCETADIRSKTRSSAFAEAVADLKSVGVGAEIVQTALPSGKKDVAGAMVGVADFSWPSAQSTILPGAICEHFTSFGGIMVENSGQTPLSEFLRYGAAGASGSVVEPYAMQDKFPLPALQVHYARGCSLAEAFYQSVFGPFQLLIVGDPLCQPWARIPVVKVEGIKAGDSISGKLNISASAKVKPGEVDRFELFVDGIRVVRRPAGAALPLDTTTLADGYHELRVVAISAGPIETQGRVILPITVNNAKQSVELTTSNSNAQWGEPLKLVVKAPDAVDGVLFFNGRSLGKFTSENQQLEVDTRQLGTGPISLFAVEQTKDKPPRFPVSKPLELVVKPMPPLLALNHPTVAELGRGMKLKKADGKIAPVQETQSADWLRAAGVQPGEAFSLDGFFDVAPPAKDTAEAAAADVAAEGVRQFQVRYTGDIRFAVDNAMLHEGKDGKDEQLFLPIALAPGLHRLRVAGRAGSDCKLQIRYGGLGTRSIDGTTFRQAK